MNTGLTSRVCSLVALIQDIKKKKIASSVKVEEEKIFTGSVPCRAVSRVPSE